jgi:N-acetylglutamate synthase-like GNAT family acetyltransferase
MSNSFEIACCGACLPDGIDQLRAEATRHGFHFLDRLVSDWHSGLNRFDQRGEQFLLAFAGNRVVGVGGLNHDPYVESAEIGRLRHLYVLNDWRRKGVGRALVERLLQSARGTFTIVRTRARTKEASVFYDLCGFSGIHDDAASHAIAI